MPRQPPAPPTAAAKPTLYDLLRVPKGCDAAGIRRAFKALALQVHPDKRPNDPNAANDFQALRRAYEILIDPARRARYDRFGDAEEDAAGFQEAYERYRGVRVTEADVDAYLREYRGGDQEARDLVAYLVERGGDVTSALAFVPGSRDEDVPRFVEVWTRAFEEGRAPREMRAAFDATKGRVRSLEELDNDEHDLEIEEGEDDDEEEDGDDDDDGFIARSDEEEEEEDDDDDEEDDQSEATEEGENDAAPRYRVGDRVQARWKGGRRWYDARVVAAARGANGAVDLEYDDGGEEKAVARRLVRPSTKPLPAAAAARAKRRRDGAEQGESGGAKPAAESGAPAARGANVGERAGRTKGASGGEGEDESGEAEDMDALRRAIAGRRAQREAGFAAFEARWAKKSGASKSTR